MEKIKGFWSPDKKTVRALNRGTKKLLDSQKKAAQEIEEKMRSSTKT